MVTVWKSGRYLEEHPTLFGDINSPFAKFWFSERWLQAVRAYFHSYPKPAQNVKYAVRNGKLVLFDRCSKHQLIILVVELATLTKLECQWIEDERFFLSAIFDKQNFSCIVKEVALWDQKIKDQNEQRQERARSKQMRKRREARERRRT